MLILFRFFIAVLLIALMNILKARANRKWFQFSGPGGWDLQRRQFLHLAFSDLPLALMGITLATLFVWAGWNGWLVGPGLLLNDRGEAPGFVFLLLDPALLNLSVIFATAFLLGLGTGQFGFTILLAVLFLFPGQLSVPAAALMVFAEMQGVTCRQFWKINPRAVLLRLGIALVSAGVLWLSGGWLRPLFLHYHFDAMQVADNLWEVFFLLLGICSLDTFLASVSFHFYSQPKGQTVIIT